MMVSIPNWDEQSASVKASEAVPMQQPLQYTQEADIVFGAYNVNNPALLYTYEALGSLMSQGAKLTANLSEIGYKRKKMELEIEIQKRKEELEAKARARMENALKANAAQRQATGISLFQESIDWGGF